METDSKAMQAKCSNFAERVAAIFDQAPFIKFLGIQFKECAPGYCETFLVPEPQHLQQDDVVHAGVVATLADHTAGGAAGTLIGEDEIVLTVEFKINLLRPAKGEKLIAKAKVIKPGKNLSIAESEVWSHSKEGPKLVAKAMVTLAVVAPLAAR